MYTWIFILSGSELLNIFIVFYCVIKIKLNKQDEANWTVNGKKEIKITRLIIIEHHTIFYNNQKIFHIIFFSFYNTSTFLSYSTCIIKISFTRVLYNYISTQY